MRITAMIEQMAEQWAADPEAMVQIEPELPVPPGWDSASSPDVDLRWRPAPDPVDGSLTQDPDFSLPTAAGPLAWRLYYNSGNAGTDSEWGYGRRASFPLRLISNGTTVTVMHEKGTDRVYLHDGGGNYSAVGVATGDTLVKNMDGTWDEVRGDTGYRYRYPVGNYVSVSYWATPQDLRITCSYDGGQRLQSLQEPTGRRLSLSYNADGKVQFIQDWADCHNTVLTYEGSDLTEIWSPEGSVTRFEYDGSHLMNRIIDPDGYVTSYTYDYSNRVLTRSVSGSLGQYTYLSSGGTAQMGFTDPNGHTWTHVSTGGTPFGKIDPLGFRETYAYESCRPVYFTDALGGITSFAFDSRGFQTVLKDALQSRWTYTRDVYGNMLSQVDPVGNVTTYTYGANASWRQVETIQDHLGCVSTFSYSLSGFPATKSDPMGAVTTYAWSQKGLLECATDPLGCCWTHQYNSVGDRTVTMNPTGSCWTAEYDMMSRRRCRVDPFGNCWTTSYDERGKIQAETDPLGNVITYSWSSFGKLRSRTDMLGRTWTTSYDAKGLAIAGIDPQGAYVTTVYDSADHPIASVDALGRRTTTVFDGVGHPIATVSPAGTRTTTSFDGVGRPIESIAPTGLVNTTVYDLAGRILATVDPVGIRQTTVYDSLGRPSARVAPTGARTTTVYDAVGRAEATVNALGYRTTTVFNQASQPVAAVNALGIRTTTVFDGNGSPIARVSPDGAIVTTVFDAAARPVATEDQLGYRTTILYDAAYRMVGSVNAVGGQMTTVYNVASERVATVDELGYRTSLSYDGAARPEAVINALGQRSTTVYNQTGAQLAQVDALGFRSTTTFDQAGRVAATQDSLGNRTTISYDSFGRTEAATNERGYTTTTVFDAVGRAVGTQDALGYRTTALFDSYGRNTGAVDPAGYRTTASFDLLDRPVGQMDARGYLTTTVFDELGRPQTSVDALGRRQTVVYDSRDQAVAEVNALGYRTSYSFDLRGDRYALQNARGYRTTNLLDELSRPYAAVDALGRRTTLLFDARSSAIRKTDGKGQVETRTYDALARYSESQYLDGTRVTVSYDAVGQVTQQAGALGLWTWGYDAVGRQTVASAPGQPNGHPLTSVYDPAGNRTALQTWRGIQTWTYDARDQVRTLVDIEAGITTWTYESRGLISRQDNPNGTWTEQTFDSNRQSATINHKQANGNWLDSALYSYDPVGNPLSLDREFGELIQYSFDNLNQLLVQNHALHGATTWTYDSVGNRITERTTGAPYYVTTCTFDAVNAEVVEEKTGSIIGSSSTANFVYDANGNRVYEELVRNSVTFRTTYSWDQSNRMTGVMQDSVVAQSNSYRPDGLRHKKVEGANTSQMIWDGDEVLAWVDGAGAVGQFFSGGAKLVKLYAPGQSRYCHSNAIGTVQAWSLPNGTTDIRDVLDAWGSNSVGRSPFTYVGDMGYWHESGLNRGLYYVRARWLVAGGPGWLSPDPLGLAGGDANLYRYVWNRPCRITDASGTSANCYGLSGTFDAVYGAAGFQGSCGYYICLERVPKVVKSNPKCIPNRRGTGQAPRVTYMNAARWVKLCTFCYCIGLDLSFSVEASGCYTGAPTPCGTLGGLSVSLSAAVLEVGGGFSVPIPPTGGCLSISFTPPALGLPVALAGCLCWTFCSEGPLKPYPSESTPQTFFDGNKPE